MKRKQIEKSFVWDKIKWIRYQKVNIVLPIRIRLVLDSYWIRKQKLFNNYKRKTALLHCDMITTQFRLNESSFDSLQRFERFFSFFFCFHSHGSLSAIQCRPFYTLFSCIFLSNLKYFFQFKRSYEPNDVNGETVFRRNFFLFLFFRQ